MTLCQSIESQRVKGQWQQIKARFESKAKTKSAGYSREAPVESAVAEQAAELTL